MKATGKRNDKRFLTQVLFFQKKNKVLAQAIAHQKDHAPLNEKKFNSVEQLPKPCP